MRLLHLLESRPPGGTRFRQTDETRVLTLGDNEPRPPFVLLDAKGNEVTLTADEWDADDWAVLTQPMARAARSKGRP